MAALGRAQVAQSLWPLIQAATWSGSLEALEPKSLAIFRLSTLRFQLLALSCSFLVSEPVAFAMPEAAATRSAMSAPAPQVVQTRRAGGSWCELSTTTQLQPESWWELEGAAHDTCGRWKRHPPYPAPAGELAGANSRCPHAVPNNSNQASGEHGLRRPIRLSAALSRYLPPYLVICRPIWLSAAKSG